MNQEQALREARKRWGKNAYLKAYPDGSRAVGYTVMDLMFAVQGQGKTWAAAFFNVDEKHHRDRLKRELEGEPCPRCSLTMRRTHMTRDVPEDEHASEEHVICRSCWMNERLPPKAHRWTEERREALNIVTGELRWLLVELGKGELKHHKERLRRMERPLAIALGQKLMAPKPSWRGKRRRS